MFSCCNHAHEQPNNYAPLSTKQSRTKNQFVMVLSLVYHLEFFVSQNYFVVKSECVESNFFGFGSCKDRVLEQNENQKGTSMETPLTRYISPSMKMENIS